MARFLRLSLALAVAGILLASSVPANVPDATLSVVPDKLTIFPDGGGPYLYPGGLQWNEMTIKGALGNVAGASVDIIFDLDAVLVWCAGQTHPIINKNADVNGFVFFEIHGGGCAETGRTAGGLYPARILADGILMRRVIVNSPDVVDVGGVMATDTPAWNPYLAGDAIVRVLGNDAVWHTTHFVNNNVEPCTKFDQLKSITDIVDGVDATVFTPFIVANAFCTPDA